jgi:hypothetical protein
LSVGAEAEVGEAIVTDVGGDGLIGEFTVEGLGKGAVGRLVDDLDLGDVGIVGGELGGIYGEGDVLICGEGVIFDDGDGLGVGEEFYVVVGEACALAHR